MWQPLGHVWIKRIFMCSVDLLMHLCFIVQSKVQRVVMDLESFRGTLGIRQEYTLDGMPVNHRASCTYIYSWRQFRVTNLITSIFYVRCEEIIKHGRNPCRHRMNSGLNQGLKSCAVVILHTAPP